MTAPKDHLDLAVAELVRLGVAATAIRLPPWHPHGVELGDARYWAAPASLATPAAALEWAQAVATLLRGVRA